MQRIVTKHPFISLIIVSILCGILWRIEIEYHGWDGLIWLSYFHITIPVGFSIFLIWANPFIDIKIWKRLLLNLCALLYGFVLYKILLISFTYNYACGPSGFLIWIQTPEWIFYVFRYLIYLIIPFIPIGAYLSLKIAGKKVSRKYIIFSVIGIIMSIPVSILILEILNHRGSHDFIHSIKSGILIPFWVFSVGLIIIGAKQSSFIKKSIEERFK